MGPGQRVPAPVSESIRAKLHKQFSQTFPERRFRGTCGWRLRVSRQHDLSASRRRRGSPCREAPLGLAGNPDFARSYQLPAAEHPRLPILRDSRARHAASARNLRREMGFLELTNLLSLRKIADLT